MAYRLRYQAFLDWVGPGQGPMGGQLTPLQGAAGGTGSGQTLSVGNAAGGQNTAGLGTTGGGQPFNGSLTTAEITTITNAMAADISAQLNLTANLSKAQGWAGGQV